MSLLERQVSASINENAKNKRVIDNANKAVLNAKKFKETSRQPQKIVYGKNSLLDKIITSNINDSIINKRLEQSSYSAINGQRQSEETYKPEGVQMLGQLGREKPLSAITKEMIKEYQEEEQAKPFMVEGEARKYMGATYEPQFPVPFEELKSTDEIDAIITRYRQGRTDTSNEIINVDSDIKEATNNIATIKNEINTKGSNFGNLYKLQKEIRNLEKFREERKKLENEIDKYNYDLKNLDNNRNEIIKNNALLNLKNREEVMKYEQSLSSANRNRLNLQQQPYESEYDYYKRLKEVEKEKIDPVLYKQYASNDATKKLKTNLDDLFSDPSFKEDVLKNINYEDKFMINKLFDKVSKTYLDQYGYNNTKLSPKMTAATLTTILNSVKNQEISPLQAIIKRNKQQEIYADTIELARDRQGLESRQAADAQQREDAATNIQRLFRGNEGRINARLAQSARAAAAGKQERSARQQEIFDRQSQRLAQYEAQQKQTAAAKLQSLMRSKSLRKDLGYDLEFQRDFERTVDNYKQEQAAARQTAADRQLARAQSIAQSRSQRNKQEQMQRIAQAQALSKEFKLQDKLKAETQAAAAERQALKEQAIKSNYARTIQRVISNYAAKKIGSREKQQSKEIAKKLLEQFIPQSTITESRTSPAKPGELPAYLFKQKMEEEIRRNKTLQGLQRAQLFQPEDIRMNFSNKPNKEINESDAAEIIKQSLKDTKNKAKIMEAVKKAIVENQKPIYVSSPTPTGLSGATTVQEQIEAGLRKQRSDIGSSRAPYSTKKAKQRELDDETLKTLTEEETTTLRKGKRSGKTVSQMLNIIRETRSQKIDEGEEEPMAKTSAPRKGEGLRKPLKKQQSRRRDKVSQEEKKKDRLRLVVAQIKAGNTNPRLIVEINKLYKDLYDIENAYMMLK